MKRAWLALLLVACASVPVSAHEGCVVSFARNEQGDVVPLYRRAIIVGETFNDELLVRIPGELQPVNMPKWRVLRRGEFRIINHSQCRCPE